MTRQPDLMPAAVLLGAVLGLLAALPSIPGVLW